MDATALQDKVDGLTTQVATDEATLSTDRSALEEAKLELSQVVLINQLEALTSDEVTTINEALAGDAQNTSGITLTLPVPVTPTPAPEAPPSA